MFIIHSTLICFNNFLNNIFRLFEHLYCFNVQLFVLLFTQTWICGPSLHQTAAVLQMFSVLAQLSHRKPLLSGLFLSSALVWALTILSERPPAWIIDEPCNLWAERIYLNWAMLFCTTPPVLVRISEDGERKENKVICGASKQGFNLVLAVIPLVAEQWLTELKAINSIYPLW